MTVFKALLSRVLLLTFLAIGLCSGLSLSIQPAAAQTVVVEGNRRVDVETIRSYFSGTDQKSIDEVSRRCWRPASMAACAHARSATRLL